jgi:catechol 2,3-dioxygenase-like lactoylglutathione lyase family enzyme
MILGAHHAQITIPIDKEDDARAFYCGLLGLQEVPKPDNLKGRGGFWLQLSNMHVHSGGEDGYDRTKSKAHVAYEVSDLSEVRAVLEKTGAKILEGIPIPGYERFECRDPFGNRMEFIQRIG